MASNFFKIKKGANIDPTTGSTVTAKGDIAYNSSTDKVEIYNGAADSVVQEATSATLTNKNLSDTTSAVVNASDATKKILFDASGSATNKTVTLAASTATSNKILTLPNATDTLVGKDTTDTLTNKSMSGSSNTFTSIPNSATTATSSNTNSTIVARDGSGNFSAGTVSAALTGTASGNTTYTANQYGVVLSGSANAMAVLAPDADTTKVLTSGGASANPSWAAVPSAPTFSFEQLNLGLSTSVSANALTIALKQSDGSTDASSGGSAVKLGFRSATATSGGYNIRSVTSSLSIVVPSGATLGHTSAMNQYVWVYAMDNAGTVELAVSGVDLFPDYSIQSSTTIGAGSTSGSTLYSTTGRSNLPIRLIGRLLVNEATAGTWASAVSDVCIFPNPVENITPWGTSLSFAPSAGFGTVSNASYLTRRVGDTMEAIVDFKAGTVAATIISLAMPSGYVIDSTKVAGGTTQLGSGIELTTSATPANINNSNAAIPFYASPDTGVVYIATRVVSNTFKQDTGSGVWTTNDTLKCYFKVPIVGWSTYGP